MPILLGMVFQATDRDKIVIADDRLVVAGGRVRRQGVVVESLAPPNDLVDVHGSPLRFALIAVATAALACAVAVGLGPSAAVPVCGVLLLAAAVRAAVVHRRTAVIAARLQEGTAYALSDPDDRLAFAKAVELAARMTDRPDDATEAIRDIGSVLRRRRRLREIRDELAARDAAMPAGFAEADREQRARVADLWAEVEHDLNVRLAALETTAAATPG